MQSFVVERFWVELVMKDIGKFSKNAAAGEFRSTMSTCNVNKVHGCM